MLGTASLCRAQETSEVRARRARRKKVVRTGLPISYHESQEQSFKLAYVSRPMSALQIKHHESQEQSHKLANVSKNNVILTD